MRGAAIVLVACLHLAILSAFSARAAVASPASPIGEWLVSDEASGQPQAVVSIRLLGDELHGRVVRILDAADPDPHCRACSGPNHDQPVLGMELLWNLHRDHEDERRWKDGYVLDPESGEIYHASLVVEDGGQQLQLRGYIGVPLLGRTERWRRYPAPP